MLYVKRTYLYQSTALSYRIHFHLCWQYWKVLSFKKQSFMFSDVERVFHLCGSHHYTETTLILWQHDSILCYCLQSHYSILKEIQRKLVSNVSLN